MNEKNETINPTIDSFEKPQENKNCDKRTTTKKKKKENSLFSLSVLHAASHFNIHERCQIEFAWRRRKEMKKKKQKLVLISFVSCSFDLNIMQLSNTGTTTKKLKAQSSYEFFLFFFSSLLSAASFISLLCSVLVRELGFFHDEFESFYF